MLSHPNARLIGRPVDDRVPLKTPAAQAGISLRRASTWQARFRDGGVTVLADRRSVRRSQCSRLL
jgi:hypothetical protein